MSNPADVADLRRLSLIVPCYNEEKRLNVERFRAFLATPGSTRLVFVDDGSNDRTLEVLESLCSGSNETAEVLRCETNKGKAEAVRSGMVHALRNHAPHFVGFWDADLATPLESISPFLDVLACRPDVQMVFGARVKLLGRTVQRKEFRHYVGRIFATVVSLMLRMPIYDTQCGAKIFRTSDALTQVLSQPFLSKWVFDVEILARFLRIYGGIPHELSSVIYEYPLESWIDVDGSKIRPADFVTALRDVARIRRTYL
jgi:glycosyltransferase involved in cell wall biosynthesis